MTTTWEKMPSQMKERVHAIEQAAAYTAQRREVQEEFGHSTERMAEEIMALRDRLNDPFKMAMFI